MKYIKLFEAFTEEEKWWKKYTKYELSAYPTNIPEDKVKIDLSGDIDTHPVMTWDSPKTGKKVYAYTKARMEAQKDLKYERIGKMTDEQVEKIKVLCHNTILDKKANDETKQAAAVISIIAQTGLRPGSTSGFEKTHNRGVTTLAIENIQINKDTIKLDFIGKSFKNNIAEIKDGILSSYLQKIIKGKKPEEFIFSISKQIVETYYKKTLEMGNFKIKDLRTFIANKIAKEFLDSQVVEPLPSKSKDIKKFIKDILKKTFEYVSKQLNNSPSMAKTSYVNPSVINDWLSSLGLQPQLSLEEETNEIEEPTFVGNAPTYELPNWWDDDSDIELVKVK